jgi:hypothetical protein
VRNILFSFFLQRRACAQYDIAFIEKLLNLDEKQKYFVITCGEEIHFAYNRVGLALSTAPWQLNTDPASPD